MAQVTARPFAAGDGTACLALFDGNVPRFFAAEERAEFEAFLAGPALGPDPYLVLDQNGALVGCGGLSRAPGTRRVSLSWGMVDRARQGQGLGRMLTETRLALARTLPGIDTVALNTSQHTQGFYARFGFAVEKITPDGFGPGLDRWDMILRL